MTEQTRHGGRPLGHTLSDESRAAIADGVTRAWTDPEKRARLTANKAEAIRKGWETRRRKAAEAALLVEQTEPVVIQANVIDDPEEDTE